MMDYIVEYQQGDSFAVAGALVVASVSPTSTSAIKMWMVWRGAKILLAAYDPTAGWFSSAPASPIICPPDAQVVVEGQGTGSIVWRSV